MAKAVKEKRKRSKLTAYNNWGYFFVAPFVIVFLIFSVYPVLRTLYLSFTDLKVVGTPKWIWFDNYKRVFGDKFFWKALGNTMRIWVVNIVLQLGLAFLLMVIFSDVKYKMKGLRVFRIVYYLPNLIAATSIAFLFSTFFMYPYGDFNNMITAVVNLFGKVFQRKDWLGSSDTAGYVIAVIQSWMWFGNSFLMLMAGVQGISKDYFEAAAIDGAGRWTIFTKITLPLIRPILMYVAITSLIGGVQMFDLPYLMISPSTASYGKVQTAMMYLYKFGFTTGTTQTGYASSIAYTMFLIILVASVVEFWLFNRKKEDER
ncbi:MAG: sugar ABC transporter permease [Lachnospiraceae bacterium]|nr:sugar ABC transporter permease [Lachnospiraceae bacterium]